MTELEPRAGEELERHLDRFARLRLDPSPGQAKRARSAVMEAAWRRKLEGTTAAAAKEEPLEPSVTAAMFTVLPAPARPAAAVQPDRGLFGAWGARRLGVSFAAAILAGLTIGSSVFAASRAGGPLYETRIAIEEFSLPSDARARVEAELALAQSRLAEIVESVAKDDQRAVAASVAAYLAALDDLGQSTGGPADRALGAIQQHQEVLEDVLGKVPAQARGGIENALARSGKVIERLDAVATPTPGEPGTSKGARAGNPNAGPGANNGNGGENPNAGPGANNGKGEKPDPTPRPARTPKPAKTAAPDPTVRPTPVEQATPTEQPTPKGPGPRNGKP